LFSFVCSLRISSMSAVKLLVAERSASIVRTSFSFRLARSRPNGCRERALDLVFGDESRRAGLAGAGPGFGIVLHAEHHDGTVGRHVS
jgi:hypothetical protein